jgi:hypothetical protein
MGLFSWLKPEPRPSARAPSAEYPTPYDAILSLIQIDLERGDCNEWVTLHAANGSREAMIQTAQRTINLVSHELDLPSLLLKHGEQEISQKAVMGGRKQNNASLWEVQSGTPSEVARVVDLVFEIEFGLGRGYSVDGSLGH